MSSKDSILASIRRHTGARHEMPELTLEAITYADKSVSYTHLTLPTNREVGYVLGSVSRGGWQGHRVKARRGCE